MGGQRASCSSDAGADAGRLRTGARRALLLAAAAVLGTLYAGAKVHSLYGYGAVDTATALAPAPTTTSAPGSRRTTADANTASTSAANGGIVYTSPVMDDFLWVPPAQDSNLSDPYPVYIRSAYYIESKKLLRLIAIRQCYDKSALDLFVSASVGLKLNSRVISACPWHFNPMCHHAGFFLDVKLPSAPTPGQTVSVRRSTPLPHPTLPHAHIPVYWVPSSPPATGAAFLTVCVQPAYLYADWVQLAQFAELWQATGASKIYLYVQSYAPELKPLLDAYVEDGLIELVPWSYLPPIDEPDLKPVNANFDVYRTEVVAALNDCVLRAAADGATFTAFVDLDEYIYVNGYPTVAEYLSKLPARTATVMFASSNTHCAVPDAYYPSDGGSVKLNDVDLSYLADAKRESFVHPYGRRSKLIIRPTAMDAMHVHDYLRLWPTSKGSPKLASLKASTKDANGGGLTLHMRRVASLTHGERNATVELPHLRPAAEKAAAGWRSRLTRHPALSNLSLPSRGLRVIAGLERCAYDVYNRWNETCTSVQAECVGAAAGVDKKEWVLADGACWTVV